MTRLYIARITLEAVSPLSVGSGEAGVSDVSLVRDANGLPMIAGASIQGLMKALATRDNAAGLNLLGSKETPAKIQFSDARIHDSEDIAVSGVMFGGVTDALLQRYLVDEPLKRDHVRIDHRGASDADDRGKFDRAALPRGTRLSFELTMWEKKEDEAAFTSILSLVHHPLFRLGGATRRGYGRVAVKAGRWRFWDDPAAHAPAISELRAKPYSYFQDVSEAFPQSVFGGVSECEITLKSDNWWRAGGDGARVCTDQYQHQSANNRDKDTDLAFSREPSICWKEGSNQKGWIDPGDAIAEDYVLAGSSIRGALWHRTLFHWNLLNGVFIDLNEKDDSKVKQQSKPPPALLALFGDKKEGNEGQKSALIIDDIVFKPANVTAADHVSIDRFTGGARTEALFSEELVKIGGGGEKLHIIIDEILLNERLSKLNLPVDEKPITDAFKAALDDLCSNRLALGAKSSGYFTGTCTTAPVVEDAS